MIPTRVAPDQLIALGVFIVLLPVFGALVLLIVRERGRIERAWLAFARGCDDGSPMIVGTYRNVPVRISAGRYGVRSAHFTRLTASCPRLPNHFVLHSQDVLFKLQKVFGVRDIEVGDATFDRAFVVQGVDENEVRTLLAAATLRRRLLACFQSEPDLEVSHREVTVQKVGVVTRPAKLRSMLEATTEVALALDSAAASAAIRSFT
jgi:hypothetical protein